MCLQVRFSLSPPEKHLSRILIFYWRIHNITTNSTVLRFLWELLMNIVSWRGVNRPKQKPNFSDYALSKQVSTYRGKDLVLHYNTYLNLRLQSHGLSKSQEAMGVYRTETILFFDSRLNRNLLSRFKGKRLFLGSICKYIWKLVTWKNNVSIVDNPHRLST